MTVSLGKPIWETPAGDLGTIQEGKFYQLTLTAYDDLTNDASTLYYIMLAGELPEGVQCRANGIIEGIPKAVSSLQGVPNEVGQDVTSKFTVRVYTEDENEQPLRVADRTFSLTVTGQDAPEWTTPAGSLGTYIDGQQVSLQLKYTDPDPDQTVTANLLSGELPYGLTLSSSGLLSGVLLPVSQLPDDAQANYDMSPFATYPFDFTTRSSSKNYQFTVEITDGYESNVRTFELFVYSRDDLTADTSLWTADNSVLTADLGIQRTPYLTTPSTDLGTVRHNNFFAYKFTGVDTDGDAIEYSVTTGSTLGYDAAGARFDEFAFDRGDLALPPGLSIEPTTGWFYGYIPDQGLTETEYTFGIQVKKRDYPEIISPITYFTITIIGNIDTDVTWTQDTTLGTLKNGEISKLSVEAVMESGAEVQYRLKSGTNSKLPQGLSLLSDGTISGQASFQSFTLDKGTTTFDEELTTRLVVDPTTFDRTYTFTVEAYNDEKQIATTKVFKILMDVKYLQPYESLYVNAMPEQEDRDVLAQLLQNTEIFQNQWIYRPDDPYYGRATSVKYQHAFGLKAASLDDYVEAFAYNHYKKDLTIGDIKVAQALDSNDNVVYEVVYADIEGGLTNNDGKSVSLAVTLDESITIDNVPDPDSTISTVYPNSLLNMQTRVIDQVGQFAEILPDWMKSKQEDGRVLGFTPAWVIAYTKPGFAKRIQYLINEKFTQKLNKIDFTIDRFVVDRRMTQNWDFTNKEWTTGQQTTFDKLNKPSQTTYKATVDYATELALADIDGRTLDYIAARGGIDNATTKADLNGKTLVFVKQEGFAVSPDEAFTDSSSSIVDGQDDERADSTANNDRMNIWTISVDSSNVVTLTNTTDTANNDYIKVRSGFKYGSNFLFYPVSPNGGLRYVNWQYLDTSTGNEATFDLGSTRFISNVDTYIPTDDRLDKYVLYPKHNILGNKDYITNG